MPLRLATKLLIILSISSTSSLANANLQHASDRLCEKVKMCAYEEMKKNGELLGDMQPMVDGMLNQMCAQMVPSVEQFANNAELRNQAVACMSSLADLTCEQLMGMQHNTKACEQLDRKASR